MKTIRRSISAESNASKEVPRSKRRSRRRPLLVMIALVLFPVLGTLTSGTAIDESTPSVAAAAPHNASANTRLDATTHQPPAHGSAAKKRAARLLREAALRRRERLAKLANKHRAAKNAATAIVKNDATTPSANTNIAPEPDFLSSCRATDEGITCLGEEIEAINNARVQEGLVPMNISVSAFSQLTTAEQMFALTDLERVARNLPPVDAMTTQLDDVAEAGANNLDDPSLSGWQLTGSKGAIAWDSNWAGGLSTAGADYFWLYSDGEGFNIDCTPTDQSGCWQHLDNILAPITSNCGSPKVLPKIVMGAATSPTSQYGVSDAEIIVQECGGLPTDTVFTWKTAQRLLGIST